LAAFLAIEPIEPEPSLIRGVMASRRAPKKEDDNTTHKTCTMADAALPQALFVPAVPVNNKRSKAMKGNSSTGTMSEKDPNKKFTETVERIVRRVAMQEGREHMEPSQQKEAATRQAGQGPLSVQELSELSLLCTVASAMSQAASPQHHHQHDNNSVATQGFATVDGDQLVALLELLDRHVNLAARVHLIQDAINVMHQQESPSKASASLDQVRANNNKNAVIIFYKQ
jgi:hypothetical protein